MMLRELHIRNFSIIDDVSMEFGEGFNVLTGETGAGKSIIINALSLALGERASGDLIRSGEKEAVIEAFFDVPAQTLNPSARQYFEDSGIDVNDGLILKRIISAEGRNRAYINSSMVNVQTLSEISRSIIDVHGQYEHQSLLAPEKQLDLLDAYGGLTADRDAVKKLFEDMSSIKQRIAELAQIDRDRADRTDMLAYQINEIVSADLKDGEEEELSAEAKILTSSVRLAELANNAYESLYSAESSCIATFSKILDAMKEISAIDPGVNEHLRSAEDAMPLLEETGYFLRDYREKLDFRPERLDQVQERLELIRALRRKYGGSIREVLDHRERAEAELEGLRNSEERLGVLKKELEDVRTVLTKKALGLSNKRKTVAAKIESKVVAQLAELSMPDTRFSIRISHEKGDDTDDGLRVNRNGIDSIEYMISPNTGEDLRPLSKTASGGELSRTMLALKVILAKGDNIPVLVFDEIDSGIGGMAAGTVG